MEPFEAVEVVSQMAIEGSMGLLDKRRWLGFAQQVPGQIGTLGAQVKKAMEVRHRHVTTDWTGRDPDRAESEAEVVKRERAVVYLQIQLTLTALMMLTHLPSLEHVDVELIPGGTTH